MPSCMSHRVLLMPGHAVEKPDHPRGSGSRRAQGRHGRRESKHSDPDRENSRSSFRTQPSSDGNEAQTAARQLRITWGRRNGTPRERKSTEPAFHLTPSGFPARNDHDRPTHRTSDGPGNRTTWTLGHLVASCRGSRPEIRLRLRTSVGRRRARGRMEFRMEAEAGQIVNALWSTSVGSLTQRWDECSAGPRMIVLVNLFAYSRRPLWGFVSETIRHLPSVGH